MPKLAKKTVLIDDSDIELFIQRRFLEVYDFSQELLTYKSAEEALNWLRKLDKESAPDVIFLDLNMPQVDGFTFLKNFDELSDKIQSKTKIVVLTSSNNAADRDKAFQNKNVIQFITKPLKQADIDELTRILKDDITK